MQVFGCRKKMSAIAILEYGGANELFTQMSALAQKGREDYQLYYEEETLNDNSDVDPLVPSLPTLLIRTMLPSHPHVMLSPCYPHSVIHLPTTASK